MKVLFATPELAPWMKSGGLGEISWSLPAALLAAGVDARILVPAYTPLLAAFPKARLVADLAPAGGELPASRLLEAKTDSGVSLLLLDCPAFFQRTGTAYLDADGIDFTDNHLRFGLLSKSKRTASKRDGSEFAMRRITLNNSDTSFKGSSVKGFQRFLLTS